MAQLKSGSTVNGEPIVAEAPNDGKTYVRRNGGWEGLPLSEDSLVNKGLSGLDVGGPVNIRHKVVQELDIGYPNNLIFPNATRAMQGVAFSDYNGDRIFMLQRSGGDSYTAAETNRIIE